MLPGMQLVFVPVVSGSHTARVPPQTFVLQLEIMGRGGSRKEVYTIVRERDGQRTEVCYSRCGKSDVRVSCISIITFNNSLSLSLSTDFPSGTTWQASQTGVQLSWQRDIQPPPEHINTKSHFGQNYHQDHTPRLAGYTTTFINHHNHIHDQ